MRAVSSSNSNFQRNACKSLLLETGMCALQVGELCCVINLDCVWPVVVTKVVCQTPFTVTKLDQTYKALLEAQT